MRYLDTNFERRSIGYYNGNKLHCYYNKKGLRRSYRIKKGNKRSSRNISNVIMALIYILLGFIIGMIIELSIICLFANNKDQENIPLIQKEFIIINEKSEIVEDGSNSSKNNIRQANPNELCDYEILQCLESQKEKTNISIGKYKLEKMDLPDKYYGSNADYSSFQPYMSYKAITNESSPSYKITKSSTNSYTDSNGFRRYKTNSDSQFTIDGEDDYIVALGTFYKEKGTAGERFLVTTENGMFTVITGDEKADCHTDPMNMFTIHGNGKYFGLIEWIVDVNKIDSNIVSNGTMTAGSMEELHGEITGIYKIS